MPTDAKLGILVPGGFSGTPPTLAEYSAFFRRAEELGYDSLWVIDRIFHPNSIIDPMALLTVAAGEAGHAPLNAVEGFVRQILGWREFVRGIYWWRMPEYAELKAIRVRSADASVIVVEGV